MWAPITERNYGNYRKSVGLATVIVAIICKPITIEFFPFGIANGDTEGPRGIDEFTGQLNLTVPIVFGLKNHSEIYVS